MLIFLATLSAAAWTSAPLQRGAPGRSAVARDIPPVVLAASAERRLGCMERLLDGRRSWSGAMTTAHVAAAVLDGTVPSEAELLAGLEWVIARHPMLRSRVAGRGKFFVQDAEAYPLHTDYLGRAVAYNKELLRTYGDTDVQRFEPSPLSAAELARACLTVVDVEGGAAGVDGAWRAGFDEALDSSCFDPQGPGPLWRLTLYRQPGGEGGEGGEGGAGRSALLYAANHAISDQLSMQTTLDEILQRCAASRAGEPASTPDSLPTPPSVEAALLGAEDRQELEIKQRLELLKDRARLSTIQYALFQAGAGGACVLPAWTPEPDAIGDAWHSKERSTRAVHSTVSAAALGKLRAACKARGLTVSAALCAATLFATSDAMQPSAAQAADLAAASGKEEAAVHKYKLLQALSMRPFAADAPGVDWSRGTSVAGTGSLDIVLDLAPRSASGLLAAGGASAGALGRFWECAAECSEQTRGWVDKGWARESLLLFGAGWEFMNMNRVVELSAQDRSTVGRAYSCANSNVGVYASPSERGGTRLSALHFGISQTVSAPAISVSSVTVDGTLCLSVAYCVPIWNDEQAAAFSDRVGGVLEAAAGSG